ncbi:hypothetical protein DFH27DRAFT_617162 [Peziza echinospora]|nr:hypothetical protein DFH27DRAFT_617162 [Peziza echinospora]
MDSIPWRGEPRQTRIPSTSRLRPCPALIRCEDASSSAKGLKGCVVAGTETILFPKDIALRHVDYGHLPRVPSVWIDAGAGAAAARDADKNLARLNAGGQTPPFRPCPRSLAHTSATSTPSTAATPCTTPRITASFPSPPVTIKAACVPSPAAPSKPAHHHSTVMLIEASPTCDSPAPAAPFPDIPSIWRTLPPYTRTAQLIVGKDEGELRRKRKEQWESG